jgi:hypothetical protein
MTEGFKPSFTITNRITAALTRIEGVRRFLGAATLSETWVSEMLCRALVPVKAAWTGYSQKATGDISSGI